MMARQLGMVELSAKCVGNGASNPTGLEGDATSVVRDDTGDYTITFPGLTGGLDIRNVDVFIAQAATSDLVPFATYNEANKTVTVTVKDATAGTPFSEADLSSSETLHVVVKVKTTKV